MRSRKARSVGLCEANSAIFGHLWAFVHINPFYLYFGFLCGLKRRFVANVLQKEKAGVLSPVPSLAHVLSRCNSLVLGLCILWQHLFKKIKPPHG